MIGLAQTAWPQTSSPGKQPVGQPQDSKSAQQSKDQGKTNKPQDRKSSGKQDNSKQNNGEKKGQGKEEATKGKPGETEKPSNYLFGGQSTTVLQNLFPFHSPYEGPNSLHSRDEADITQSFTIFAGYRVTREVEVFVNPEWLFGTGINNGIGLSGTTNGDLAGQGELSPDPYLARAFVRWRIPTGRSAQVGQVEVGRSENLIPGKVPARRLVFTAGKFATSDVFDPSRYANDPRTEFLSDPLANNPAIDFPQDTRGNTIGLSAAWVNPEFSLRLGSFEMPTEPGGATLSGDLIHNRGDLIEGEVYPHIFKHAAGPTIIRLLGFRNFAHMGRFRDALAGSSPGMAPDITKVRRAGAVKYGYGLSLEQAIADDGKTGTFLRYGWNNGATETFAFDEVDSALTFGGQLSGSHWRRPDDRIGVAFVFNNLSAAHRAYLTAGGLTAGLGDGQLHYGQEQWFETYYFYKIVDKAWVSLHYQLINNPGYNADRGPVSIISLRLHLELGL